MLFFRPHIIVRLRSLPIGPQGLKRAKQLEKSSLISKMSLKTLLIRQGERLTLRAIAFPAAKVGERDDCPVLAFAQEQSQIRPDEWAKLAALLDHTVTHGAPSNETKFKHLTGTDGLFEFKTGGGLRLFGF